MSFGSKTIEKELPNEYPKDTFTDCSYTCLNFYLLQHDNDRIVYIRLIITSISFSK